MRKPLQRLDDIQADEALKETTFAYVMQHQLRHRYKKQRMAIAATVACMLLLLPIVNFWQRQKTVSPNTPVIAAIISMDINPSMEFSLDQDFRVIDVTGFNTESKALLKDITYQGKTIQELLNELLQEPAYASYLKAGFLEVGVYAKDQLLSQQLNDLVNTSLQKHLSATQYHCATIDESTQEAAEQHHTSAGKYRVIESILAYNQQFTVEELSKKSMRELYEILSDYDAAAIPEGCNSSNQGKGHGHS